MSPCHLPKRMELLEGDSADCVGSPAFARNKRVIPLSEISHQKIVRPFFSNKWVLFSFFSGHLCGLLKYYCLFFMQQG